MKKSFLLLVLFTLMFLTIHSQITIVSDDIAPIGYVSAQSTDENPDAGILEGGIGNINWNFNSLQDGLQDTFIFLNPATTPYGDTFPFANLASRVDTSLHAYMIKDQDKIEIIGIGGKLEILGFPIVGKLDFTPSQSLIRFPATYGDSYQETIEQQGQVKGADIGLQIYDSIRLVTTVDRTVEIDAFGTMNIPSGAYNTIRSSETETSLYDVYVLTSGNWVFQYSLDPDTVILYNWWTLDNGLAFPVVQMEYSPITESRKVTWLRNLTSTENLFEAGASIYPNPAYGLVNIVLPDPFNGKMEVYDMNGKRILTHDLVGETTHQIDLSTCSDGTYIVVLKSQNGSIIGYEKVLVAK